MEDKDKLIADLQKKIAEQASKISAMEQEIELLNYQLSHQKQ